MTVIGNCTVITGTGQRWRGMRLRQGQIVEGYTQAVPSPDVDLDGAFVVPPLVDTHLHLVAIGQSMAMADAAALDGWDELSAALLSLAPDGNGTRFARRLPEHWGAPPPGWFERIGGRVVLLTPDLHSAWVSSRVLEDARVTVDTVDPPGGRYGRGTDGAPNGFVLDTALDSLGVRFAVDDPARVGGLLMTGMQACAEKGLHEVHEIATTPVMWQGLRALAEADALPVSVCCYGFGAPEEWSRLDTTSVGRLRFCGYKVFLDGALGSRGALLREPYSDIDPHAEDPRGLSLCSPEELGQWWELAGERDLQLAVHAIGDEAVARVLDLPRRGPLQLRVEHAQIVAPEDRPRFPGVIAAMQPHHRRDDRAILDARLGPRAAWAFPFRALEAVGAHVCFGSDAPVSELCPLEGMAAAREAGVDDPLLGYTVRAAGASRAPRCGALAVGERADFTVIDREPGESGAVALSRWIAGVCEPLPG